MAESYVCRIVQRERDACDVERGCGVIAQLGQDIWDALLTDPSCFEKKYNRSVFQSRSFYVLLTAHCNLYGESKNEDPVGKYIRSGDFSLVFDTLKIPLRECIAPVGRNDDRCIAVTCCGIDSILVLRDSEYENVKLGYTLKSHRDSGRECRNFVILFLEVEAVNRHLGSDCSPPILQQTAAVHDACMVWRTAERAVRKVNLQLEDTSELENDSASNLQCQMEKSRNNQSFNLTQVPSEVDQPCCIGAPVIMTSPDGGSAIVGINAGGRITNIHGMFAFLKGGLGHFLAAMDRTQTRTLMPSRWEHYLKSSVSSASLPTLSSVLDLLHHLLYRKSGVRILKFSVDGGPPSPEIVSGLRVYTAIFEHYRSLREQQNQQAQQNQQYQQSVPHKPCGALCHCLDQIKSDMRETLQHFSSLENPPEDIAVALFKCFEAMQSFDFDYANIAREILRENRSYLDELATKDRLDSNSSVNKSFKWIDVLARRNEERMMNAGPGFRRPIQEDYKPHSQQVAMDQQTALIDASESGQNDTVRADTNTQNKWGGLHMTSSAEGYIPESFSPVATLSQCTHDGRHYYEANDFSLEIPEGAIPEGESITIDIGVALYGPFQYPEGLIPVSPVFWLCVRDKKHFRFLKPVTVTIPHFLNLKNHNDIESLGLTFLKGDHEMNVQQMYDFRQAEGDIVIQPLQKYGALQTLHFCSLCLSSRNVLRSLEKAFYCMTAVIPHTFSTAQSSVALFFVTLAQHTCLKKLDKLMHKIPEIKGHRKARQMFEFNEDGDRDQALSIVLPTALDKSWMVGLELVNKITLSEVAFFIRKTTTKANLKMYEKTELYPPRFRVSITCTSEAATYSQARIAFNGANKEMFCDLHLIPPAPPLPPLPPQERLYLDIDDLRDVKIKLQPVMARWRDIGLVLGIADHKLESINKKCNSEVKDCLTDMLRLWLNRAYNVEKYGEPSWQTLREAIRNPAGGECPALADKI